jgi:hypothetical protein
MVCPAIGFPYEPPHAPSVSAPAQLASRPASRPPAATPGVLSNDQSYE